MKRYFISKGYTNIWIVWECFKELPDCEAEPHKEFNTMQEAEDYITAMEECEAEKVLQVF